MNRLSGEGPRHTARGAAGDAGQGAQLAVGSGDAPLEEGFRSGAEISGADRCGDRLRRGAGASDPGALMRGRRRSRFEPRRTSLCAALCAVARSAASPTRWSTPMRWRSRPAWREFSPVTAEMLGEGARQGEGALRRPRHLVQLQINGMTTDVSWKNPAPALRQAVSRTGRRLNEFGWDGSARAPPQLSSPRRRGSSIPERMTFTTLLTPSRRLLESVGRPVQPGDDRLERVADASLQTPSNSAVG